MGMYDLKVIVLLGDIIIGFDIKIIFDIIR